MHHPSRTGRRRPPAAGVKYITHVRRLLDRLSGHFHSAWLPDHFIDGLADMPEALTTLSYLAGQYPTLHFGPVVLGQNYRNPALLAKMAARAINPIFNCNIGWDETNSKHGTIVNGV